MAKSLPRQTDPYNPAPSPNDQQLETRFYQDSQPLDSAIHAAALFCSNKPAPKRTQPKLRNILQSWLNTVAVISRVG